MADIQFEIKAFTPTSWRVIITLPKKDVSDEQLLEIFRAAKKKLPPISIFLSNSSNIKKSIEKNLNTPSAASLL